MNVELLALTTNRSVQLFSNTWQGLLWRQQRGAPFTLVKNRIGTTASLTIHVRQEIFRLLRQAALLGELARGPFHTLYHKLTRFPVLKYIFTFMALCLAYELTTDKACRSKKPSTLSG